MATKYKYDKDTDYAYTAKGATTEIYVDDVNDTVTVVMINHYMAEVTKVKDGHTVENTATIFVSFQPHISK